MLIIGLIVAGLILLGVVLALVERKSTVFGTCPACRKDIGIIHGVGVCPCCDEPVRHTDGKYIVIEPGYSADAMLFVTNLSRLRHPSQWEPVRAGQCCVCGSPASSQNNVKIKSIEGQAGPLFTPMNLTETNKFEVGYCAAHSDGFRFSYPPGWAHAKQNAQCFIAIRSVDFYREFVKVNGLNRAAPPQSGGPTECWPCGHEKGEGTTRCWKCK